MKKQFLTYAVSYTEIFKDSKYFNIVSNFVEDNKRFCLKSYKKIDSLFFAILSILFSAYLIIVTSFMHMFEPLNSFFFIALNILIILLFKNDLYFNLRHLLLIYKGFVFLDKAMFISKKQYHLTSKKIFNQKFLIANIISAYAAYYCASLNAQLSFLWLNSIAIYFIMIYFYKKEINLKNIEKGKNFDSIESIQKYYGLKD